MRAINHALTGALIGLTVDNPALAAPTAFMSHFVCDIIPHYGPRLSGPAEKERYISSKSFKFWLHADAALCVLLVAILVVTRPQNWLLASVCAFLATSPDLLWSRSYYSAKNGRRQKYSRLEKLLADVQWFEYPSGALVEIAWFAVFSLMIWNFI